MCELHNKGVAEKYTFQHDEVCEISLLTANSSFSCMGNDILSQTQTKGLGEFYLESIPVE